MTKTLIYAGITLLVSLPLVAQQTEVNELDPLPTSGNNTPSATPRDPRLVGPRVTDIVIDYVGPKSVSESVILSNMRTAVGQVYSDIIIEEDVRNLFKTGLFTNLRIFSEPYRGGLRVRVIVQPRPLVRQVTFAGWSKIDEKRLRREIKTKAGSNLSESQLAADAREIQQLYQSRGFKDANVDFEYSVDETTGRANVIFKIDEGTRQIIRSIKFEGNKIVSSRELMKSIKTRPRSPISWLTGTGVLKDDQFSQDLRSIVETYQKRGYIDASVSNVEFRPATNETVDIFISLFEGAQYRVGSVTIDGNKLYTTDRIRENLRMLESGIYSPQGLDDDVKAIRDLYGAQGYIDTRVRPINRPSVEAGIMNISYQIDEGGKSFVNRVIIQGNNRTKDKVIRRELALVPGDIYNTVRAEASQKRLMNMNYFSKVDILPEDTMSPGKKDMVVTVEEKRTGSFTFGVGYSTVDSVIGFVELTQSNFDLFNFPSFVGGGQRFRARAQYGLQRQDYIISFTEPWLFDQKLLFGVEGFYRNAQYLSSFFDEERFGFNLRLARPIIEVLTARMVYKFESIGINNVRTFAPNFYKEEAGTRLRSAMEFGLSYDTRDSLFLTRKGTKVDVFFELAGGPFLGDTDLYRTGFEARQYFNLPLDMIIQLGVTGAVVDSYGDSSRVPIFDRLFIGGNDTVRGFRFRDVGPFIGNGVRIGGSSMLIINNELTFPIISRIRGAVFADGGFVNKQAWDFDYSNFNAGVGLGLRLDLPIGPLRLDLGFPVITDEFNDRGMQFHFNAGYQF
jgi:outer membrane protein insertion porin family